MAVSTNPRPSTQARRVGGALGGLPGLLLCLVLGVPGLSVETTNLVAFIGPAAIAVGILLGWWRAPAVLASSRLPVRRLVTMGLEGMLLGLVLMSVIGAIGAWIGTEDAGVEVALGNASAVFLFGLLLLGLPMLALTTGAAFAWGALLRHRLRTRLHPGSSGNASVEQASTT